MFTINSKSSILKSLSSRLFSFTDDSYLSNIERSYKSRILKQRSILEDKSLCKDFLLNFRHPESNSIIGEMHSLNGYKCLKGKNRFQNISKYTIRSLLKYLHPFAYAERDWIMWNYSQYKRSQLGVSNYNKSINDIGNPPIMKLDSTFKWNLRWLRYLYLRERLFFTLGKETMKNIHSIVDIGGCYGGFISLLAETYPSKNYTLIELGENIPLAAYYIKSIFKDKEINIINKTTDSLSFEGNIINLVPAHLFEIASNESFDLCCNYVSLGEMSSIHFKEYINSKLYKNSKLKHIVNRVSSSPYYLKNTFYSWSNNQTILDYNLSGNVKYFDIFPFTHFFPLLESKEYQSINCSLKDYKGLISSWKRCPVSSQQFECIIEV